MADNRNVGIVNYVVFLKYFAKNHGLQKLKRIPVASRDFMLFTIKVVEYQY